MTWPKTLRLFPLRGFALRLLRGLLGRGLRLPTFRHCALQLRDGAIEKVQSRIDLHSTSITTECKKQRLRLTKRVRAGAFTTSRAARFDPTLRKRAPHASSARRSVRRRRAIAFDPEKYEQVERRAFEKSRARGSRGTHEAAFPATCDVKIAAAKNLKKIFAQGRQKRIAPERNRSKTSESVSGDSAQALSSHMQPRLMTTESSLPSPSPRVQTVARRRRRSGSTTPDASRRVSDQLRRVKDRACASARR